MGGVNDACYSFSSLLSDLMVHALCEGQRLNPVAIDGDSSNGGEAFMAFDNMKDVDAKESEQEIMKEWESKLVLNTTTNRTMLNDGYLEKPVDGQFDDVENDDNKQIKSSCDDKINANNKKNPYLDPDLMKS